MADFLNINKSSIHPAVEYLESKSLLKKCPTDSTGVFELKITKKGLTKIEDLVREINEIQSLKSKAKNFLLMNGTLDSILKELKK